MVSKKNIIVLGRGVLTSAIVTAIGLAALAGLAWGLHMKDSGMNIGVVVIYILSCLIGGLTAGKGVKEKRFLWGLFTGIIYFVVLAAISAAAAGGVSMSIGGYITTALICMGSGMLGGMIG